MVKQYIGARYVPIIDGEYNSEKVYEPLTIVTYNGSSYTSKKTVPAGIVPTNTDYWALTGNYNVQVEEYAAMTRKMSGAFVTLSGIGCVEDIDNSNIIATYLNSHDTGALIVDDGIFPINGVLNIPSTTTLVFTGGVLEVNGTLAVNGAIVAPLTTIFKGNGNITINKELNPIGYPEWFEDDVVKTYSLFDCVELQNRDYEITNDLLVNRSNTIIRGKAFGTFLNHGIQGARIIENGGSIIVGNVASHVINEFPRNITLENFEIVELNTQQTPLSVYGVVYGRFKNLAVVGSGDLSRGVYCYKNVSCIYDSVRVQITNNSGTFFGFHLNDENNPIGGGGNASIYFRYCTVGDTGTPNGNSYGWFIQGSASDISLSHCETASVDNGLSILGGSNPNGFNDILLDGCIFDACRNRGITISDITVDGAISISNCYCAKANDNPTTSIMYVGNCKAGICIEGLQLVAVNENNIGLQFVGNNSAIISSAVINGMNTPYTSESNTNIQGKYLHNGSIATIS